MFFEIPAPINVFVLFLPILFYWAEDCRKFMKGREETGFIAKYKAYWLYSHSKTRNPSKKCYIVQAIWSLILLVPFDLF